MASIEIDRIVRILPALGHNHPGLEILTVELEMLCHCHGITNLLDHDHIRPEAVDDHIILFFSHVSELKSHVHQALLSFVFA